MRVCERYFAFSFIAAEWKYFCVIIFIALGTVFDEKDKRSIKWFTLVALAGFFISPCGRFVLFLEPSAKPNFHLIFHLIFIETKIFNLQVLLRSRDEKKFYVIKQGNAKQGQVWSAIDAIRSLAASTIANENSRESKRRAWQNSKVQIDARGFRV